MIILIVLYLGADTHDNKLLLNFETEATFFSITIMSIYRKVNRQIKMYKGHLKILRENWIKSDAGVCDGSSSLAAFQ